MSLAHQIKQQHEHLLICVNGNKGIIIIKRTSRRLIFSGHFHGFLFPFSRQLNTLLSRDDRLELELRLVTENQLACLSYSRNSRQHDPGCWCHQAASKEGSFGQKPSNTAKTHLPGIASILEMSIIDHPTQLFEFLYFPVHPTYLHINPLKLETFPYFFSTFLPL